VSEDKILTLKRAFSCWVLVAPKGHVVHELPPRVVNKNEAYDAARAWASSWSEFTVRFEDEQDEKRD
jgi:hypothetical protein